jgi:hypothetical protein
MSHRQKNTAQPKIQGDHNPLVPPVEPTWFEKWKYRLVELLWPAALTQLSRYRSIFFGLLFVLYVIKFQPVLLHWILQVRNSGKGDFWLALLIVVIHLCELVGTFVKQEGLNERIRRRPNPGVVGALAVLSTGFIHLPMNFFMFIFTLPAFGTRFEYPADQSFFGQSLGLFLGFGLLFKEALVLTPFFSKPSSDQKETEVDLESPRVQQWELFSELLLTIYGMVALTLTWDLMLVVVPAGDFSHPAWYYFGGVLLFFFIYPPSRLAFVAEEWYTRQTLLNRVISTVVFLTTLYVMVSSMPPVF